MNYAIDDLRKWCEEVGRIDLWVEEDLRRKEPFIAHVNLVFLNHGL